MSLRSSLRSSRSPVKRHHPTESEHPTSSNPIPSSLFIKREANVDEIATSTIDIMEEDEEEETKIAVTLCVCGKTHTRGMMICCDQCETWQHCKCLGIRTGNPNLLISTAKTIPKNYTCASCLIVPVVKKKGKKTHETRFKKKGAFPLNPPSPCLSVESVGEDKEEEREALAKMRAFLEKHLWEGGVGFEKEAIDLLERVKDMESEAV
jgi:hypothetical protein